MYIAPLWAFNAQAISAVNDPHLVHGVHLRLIPSQRLGLPVVPFFVYRIDLGPVETWETPRTDITWIDSRGRTLAAPFKVSPGNPVTGWLPPPSEGICCWIEVEARPAIGLQPVFPLPDLPLPLRPALLPDRPPVITRPPFQISRGLKVDAVVATAGGPAVVASASRRPYQLAASHIQRVVVSGSGEVYGAKWIDARELAKVPQRPWRILGLPYPASRQARYVSPRDPEREALKRVERGSPRRLGLHDEPAAALPAGASPATPADEIKRVEALAPGLMSYLRRLLEDVGLPQQKVSQTDRLLDERRKSIGEIETNCLGAVLQAALDPGVGRWLGFVDVDDSPPLRGNVTAYAVQGFWHLDWERLQELLPTLQGAPIFNDPSELARRIPKYAPHPDAFDRLKGPFLELWTVACATIGIYPDRPGRPLLGRPENGPWMPVLPPRAEREVVIPAGGLVPGAQLALARKEGQAIFGLNPRSAVDRALPLVPSVPDDAETTGTGEFADRSAPPEEVSYRAAQADWFGRWSDWAERKAEAAVRPRPPRPTVHAFYMQPEVGDPVSDSMLQGTIQVRVSVPKPEALPPGARLLAALELVVDGAEPPITVSVSLPAPHAPPEELIKEVSGPAMERAGRGSAAVTARWVDSAGVKSPDAEPVVLELHDPRPPQPVSLPETLQYASRPDVSGRSRVELSWPASSNQKRFRVFYADETRLLTCLENKSSGSEPVHEWARDILEALAGSSGAPGRAAVFVDNAAFFTRDMFEQLTGQPIENRGGQDPVRFEHALSGSLRVLSFYRVVSISEANVEGPFTAAPMVAVGVPGTGPPPQPFLNVEAIVDPQDPDNYRARLTLRVPPGVVPAVEYRLRRGTGVTGDILQMPVACTGNVPLADSGKAQEVQVVDAGGSDFEPGGTLKPWITYCWRAEVKGAPEPGGGPKGQWSQPSATVSTMLLPPGPPPPAYDLTAAREGDAVTVRWKHPQPLRGGMPGRYSLDLYRQLPGQPERFLASITADAPPAAGGRDADRQGQFHYRDEPPGEAGPVPAGTRYRVVVMDPIGRASPPAQVVVDSADSA